MEISVSLEKVLPMQSGISKAGKEWRKLEFIGNTFDQYPKRICFSMMNQAVDNYAPMLVDAAALTISFDLESRSFMTREGKEMWSTEVRVWKVEEYKAQATSFAPTVQQEQPQVIQQPQPQVVEDLLPF